MRIATTERSPALPDVPTTKEAGLPDYQVSAWNALFAPKGTPKEIVDQAQRDAVEGARRSGDAQAPARSRQRAARRQRPFARALAELVKSEVARWTPILKAAGAVGTQ